MLRPKISILLIRSVAIFTGLLFLIIAFGTFTDYFDFLALRLAISICLLFLAVLSYMQGYRFFGSMGILLTLLFNPFGFIHLPRYIWTMIDVVTAAAIWKFVCWTTDPYEKGIRFEQYVSTLFPEPDFAICDRTRDTSKFSRRRVESDTHPDFLFRNRRTGNVFAVECKWRGQWAKWGGEGGLWWNMPGNTRYMRYEKERGVPVFVALGIGGTPEHPKEVYFLEPARLQCAFLKQSLIRSGKKSVSF